MFIFLIYILFFWTTTTLSIVLIMFRECKCWMRVCWCVEWYFVSHVKLLLKIILIMTRIFLWIFFYIRLAIFFWTTDLALAKWISVIFFCFFFSLFVFIITELAWSWYWYHIFEIWFILLIDWLIEIRFSIAYSCRNNIWLFLDAVTVAESIFVHISLILILKFLITLLVFNDHKHDQWLLNQC